MGKRERSGRATTTCGGEGEEAEMERCAMV